MWVCMCVCVSVNELVGVLGYTPELRTRCFRPWQWHFSIGELRGVGEAGEGE